MRRLAFAFAVILAFSVRADVLVLDDGTRVEGKIHKDGDQWVVIDASGHETDVPAERITVFQIGGPHSDQPSGDKLATLREEVGYLNDIPTIIETLSAGITLLPGDVIATGTPAGVGIGFKPPRFLKKGDVMKLSIDMLGTLTNHVK